MTRRRGIVYSVGVNDADYPVEVWVDGKLKVCPFYRTWCNLLSRGCEEGRQTKKDRDLTYKDCTICDEWLVFSNFKAWMEKQDWKGKHLDKDFIKRGNRIYSPDTCVFVPQIINNFLTLRSNHRGAAPLGVCWHKASNKYTAGCNDPFVGKLVYLGIHSDAYVCHRKWQERKLEVARKLLTLTDDIRVTKGIQGVINKLENDITHNLETKEL